MPYKHRIVFGVYSAQARNDLFKERPLTLTKCIDTCRTNESAASQQKARKADSRTTDSSQMDMIRCRSQRSAPRLDLPNKSSGKFPASSLSQSRESPQQNDLEKCGNCGYEHEKGQCPAYRHRCYSCGRLGHYRKLCRKSRNRHQDVVEERETDFSERDDNDDNFFGAVEYPTSRPWIVTLAINGSLVDFKVDTGADASVISENTFRALKYRPTLFPCDRNLSTLNGKLECLGWFSSKTVYDSEDHTFRIYVLKNSSQNNLLSRDVSTRMKLVTPSPNLNIVHLNTDGHDIYGKIDKPALVEPVTLKLKDGYDPYHVSAPRKVPVPLQEAVSREIQWMLDHDIIRPVKEPTEWCAPITLPIKKNGKLRVCVDLRQLNRHLLRPKFPLPTLEDIMSSLAGSKFFSKLDASRGYWQLPLSESCQLLTTFMTSQGRFCFKRLPYGICVASDVFQNVMSQTLCGLPGVVCYQDDILIHAATKIEHDERLNAVLTKLSQINMKLNKDKCVYSQTQLEFLGHLITPQGCLPDPAKVQAIAQLPDPTAENLRSVVGMVNYLGRFVPNLQSIMKPINDLLKSDVEFVWGSSQSEAFNKVKTLLTKAPVLSFFDPKLPTVLSCDASSYGVGSVLMQDHDGQLRPIAFASRMLSTSEQHYAQIEKECLSCTWACEKFSMYLLGLDNFRLQTDHKPLVPLVASKDIDKVPARIQRLLIRLMPYNCVPEHVPGKSLIVADTLSRIPVVRQTCDDNLLALEIEACTAALKNSWSVSSDKLEKIRCETEKDPVLSVVLKHVSEGWPKHDKDVSYDVRPYFTHNAHLSVLDGILTFDNRIVIPKTLQTDILERIHAGHWGITKSCRFAAETVWWIGMSADIKRTVNNCEYCQTHQATQHHEPLLSSDVPTGPWVRIGVDLFQLGRRHFVVAMDYYSKYIEISEISSQTSRAVVTKMKSMFARWGIPKTVVSDNGPCFASEEFSQFMKSCGINHTTTSPHYPQANGQAESGVKIAEKIVRQEDPFLALLSYRATPTQATGQSPAQLMMGRKIATHLPVLEKCLKPCWPDEQVVKCSQENYKRVYTDNFNKQHGARPLPKLQPGDSVRVKTDGQQSWNTRATVVDHHSTPRSYIVQTHDGSTLRRNRRHLQSCPVSPNVPQENDSPPVVPVDVSNNTPDNPAPETPKRPIRSIRPPQRLIQEMDEIYCGHVHLY